jgi:hypothetical protein
VFIVECSKCGVSGGMSWAAKSNGWHFSAGADLCPSCFAAPERVGFERPEPGSRDRYDERRRTQPWAAHTFWWIVHNAVAHPLIAFAPRAPFFRFHDWTSYKMHGVSRR